MNTLPMSVEIPERGCFNEDSFTRADLPHCDSCHDDYEDGYWMLGPNDNCCCVALRVLEEAKP